MVPPEEQAAQADRESLFLKINRDASGKPESMSTSVVRYSGTYTRKGTKSSVPIDVDLVSAVHIAEQSYYDELNRRFATYDTVLFELIGPEDLSVEMRKSLQHRERGENPISMIQQTMQTALGLQFQLEQIDYSKKNFVHADLSPEGFQQSLKSRGDSMGTLFMRLVMQGMLEEQKNQNPYDGMLLMMAFVTSTEDARPFVLRRYLAEHFRQLDSLTEKIEGPKGSAIVSDRNDRALQVLKRELEKGSKRFAIFYGAAHMPKFQEKLEQDFHLHRTSVEWIPAWHLQPPSGVK